MVSPRLNPYPLLLADTVEFSIVQVDALELLAKEILNSFEVHRNTIFPQFEGLSKEELLIKFDFFREEVQWNAMLVMLATIEATIRLDYLEKRRKGKRFRTLYSQFGARTPLED